MTNPIERLAVQATVAVDVGEDEAGLWYATFVRFGELLAFGNTRDEVLAKIPGAIGELTAVNMDPEIIALQRAAKATRKSLQSENDILKRAAKAMIPIFCDHGMPISCPDDGDLDDVEMERWNALVEAARAAIETVPTADAIDAWLNTAPLEKVKALHDLCHAAVSDRFGQGMKPPQRTLRKTRATIDSGRG